MQSEQDPAVANVHSEPSQRVIILAKCSALFACLSALTCAVGLAGEAAAPDGVHLCVYSIQIAMFQVGVND